MQEMDYRGIGMRIRKARKAKRLSQGELSKKCGICLSFMGHIERGTRCMSLETFAKICEELEVTADELLWDEKHFSMDILDTWKKLERTGSREADCLDVKKDDSYSMYVKIMKSVAEIMNG